MNTNFSYALCPALSASQWIFQILTFSGRDAGREAMHICIHLSCLNFLHALLRSFWFHFFDACIYIASFHLLLMFYRRGGLTTTQTHMHTLTHARTHTKESHLKPLIWPLQKNKLFSFDSDFSVNDIFLLTVVHACLIYNIILKLRCLFTLTLHLYLFLLVIAFIFIHIHLHLCISFIFIFTLAYFTFIPPLIHKKQFPIAQQFSECSTYVGCRMHIHFSLSSFCLGFRFLKGELKQSFSLEVLFGVHFWAFFFWGGETTSH